ncbi:MAG: tetratricopeptide repeat protein [Candidatus Binatia bacterium]
MAAEAGFTRKDLKTPDAFFETVGKVNRYVTDNRRSVLTVTAAVVLVFGAGAFFSARHTRSEQRAAAAFNRALDAISADSYATAETVLAKLATDSARPYGSLARLYKAGLAQDRGDYATARREYAAFAVAAQTPYLRQIALVGEAFAAEMLSDYEAARSSFEAASHIAAPYREQALRGMLRVADKSGDVEAALEAVNGLLEHFPGASDAGRLAARQQALSN